MHIPVSPQKSRRRRVGGVSLAVSRFLLLRSLDGSHTGLCQSSRGRSVQDNRLSGEGGRSKPQNPQYNERGDVEKFAAESNCSEL